MFARLIFSIVDFGARKGLSRPPAPGSASGGALSAKLRARQTGVRGETYAYWYLRRHGYTLIARNLRRTESKARLIWSATTAPCWLSSR